METAALFFVKLYLLLHMLQIRRDNVESLQFVAGGSVELFGL